MTQLSDKALVLVEKEGWIALHTGDGAMRLSQAEAVELAVRLLENVQRSIDREQRKYPAYFDSARILERMESPLGRAIKAASDVYGRGYGD